VFGKLRVIRDLPARRIPVNGNGKLNYRRVVLCRCECGRPHEIRTDHLTDRATPAHSCGQCDKPVTFDPRTAGRIASVLYDLDRSDRRRWRVVAIRLLTGGDE
jgi:hypothetical protein